MSNKAVANRYAQALYDIVDAEAQEQVAEELTAISQALQEPDVSALFANPRIPRSFKEKLITDMQPSPHTEALLRVMLENRRLQLLSDAAAAFQELVYRARGKAKAEVLSAVPLSTEALQELRLKLSKLTGKTVELTASVDERLWGGLRIRVDGKVIDGSLAHRLARVKEQLLK